MPNKEFMIIGGLNEDVPLKPTFLSTAYLVKEVKIGSIDGMTYFVPEPISSMFTKRGCFSGIYHEGNVYVFGGINYSDRIMNKSE